VPRRLTTPEPPLADGTVRLAPLSQEYVPELLELIADDAIQAYTLVPSGAGEEFLRGWVARYEQGWREGTRAGFAIRSVTDDSLLGFAMIFHLDLAGREGEIGYAVAPAARRRGVAGQTLELLTRWCFDEIGLERIELQIDATNTGSERVAERVGYRREGVRRSVHFKEGRRVDLGVWARLSADR